MRRKLLIIYDVDGWAYHRRAIALKKYAPSDFEVDIEPTGKLRGNFPRLGQYDICFNIDYMTRGYRKMILKYKLKTILVISHNRDSQSRLEYWGDSYNEIRNIGWLICNNQEIFDYYKRLGYTCNISNGVDTTQWYVTKPMLQRPKRVIWCGSSSLKKGKGYKDILVPLEPMLHKMGFETSFRPIDHIDERVYGTKKQLQWYNDGAIVLCASEHEGTPNFILEGAACGCVPVSTFVGNIREFGANQGNCVIVERNIDSILRGIKYAWEHREVLSRAAVSCMRLWDWSYRSKYFYQLFRRLMDDGRDSIKPFTFNEITPEQI